MSPSTANNNYNQIYKRRRLEFGYILRKTTKGFTFGDHFRVTKQRVIDERVLGQGIRIAKSIFQRSNNLRSYTKGLNIFNHGRIPKNWIFSNF